MSMSTSRVLSSDSSEHSTPLSNNKERRGTNDAPLMRSLSVLDNVDNNKNNNNDQRSLHRQPSSLISSSAQPTVHPTTPTATSSKYTRRPPLALQQPQHQDDDQAKQARLPPSPGTLARHGIKVRDFAYESDLPLIPSIPRVRQVVGARPLKRTRRYFEPSDDIFMVDIPSQSQSSAAGPSSLDVDQHENVSQSSQSRPLERKSTEPIIVPERESQQRPYRDVGYSDLSQMPSGSQPAQTSLHHTLTLDTPTPVNRTSTFSPVSLPFPFPPFKKQTVVGGSQESESSTDTPLVTPNGSLTWPTITSDMPASQLDIDNDNNDTQPSALVHDSTITYSQLGFSPSFSQAPHSDFGAGGTTMDALGSPRPTEVASSPLQPLLDDDDDNFNNARASSSPSSSPTRLTRAVLPLSSPAAPRYFLRRHGSPRQDHASTPSPHRRRKPSMRAPGPYPSRVTPVTRQAAHATASGSSGRSPRARPLRKTAIP